LNKIHKVLIGIAFSPNLKSNLFEAVRMANMFDAQLICVHVGAESDQKKEDLSTLLKETEPLKKPLKVIWQTGNPVDVILKTCSQEQIDLLILGALQQENLLKYYVGSIARKLTRKAPCSVLLMIKPSVIRVPCKHIVVNGLHDTKTAKTIETAFHFSKQLNCKKVTIVEEVSQSELHVEVHDDRTLRKSTIVKERIKNREDHRIKKILTNIDSEGIIVKMQSIFGRRGYSIGHYAKVKRADLLVMNAPDNIRFIDRIFPHDIEYILSELPTDVLIVK
jgi:nucleotide-binding universal stress UspA family protein